MELIKKYFPNLDSYTEDKLSQLGDLYTEWNAKINVISRKDMDHFYERHVLHSLSIASFIQFEKGTQILDVGCGGGFPSIPLAIMYPDCQFHSIDSIGKKIKVVKGVAEALGLKNLTAEQVRVENHPKQYDFIISRAVTAFPAFVSLCQNKILQKNNNAISNGIIYLKGGDFDEELKNFKKRASVTPLGTYFEEEFFETKKIIHLSM
ncbi:16S rRNA (guanine(527)-N(7))-methyltransferase RsmG [Carboxylicivirga sp. M1479]|uniref:16S rRNA (guanine(527)-N(7))-methyltransferase RsmG n=1 Tax=Carboxylicivirga sp. M1479 TaxID=2594476 RepID=UPI0011782F94|nr:16S rRNA (guanine(527)-N(7))-methyltransferase RsmG [Carboxylicivirga sp. M1479]TRX71560.1 16S rRNA (guanine(527)-N(7))-methyltransferase RsmG [Carboxylicivirga sp. M1479]